MEFSVQTDNLKSLQEAVNSKCSDIRFGSEFCEYKIPRLEELQKAYQTVCESNKTFTYVTPRLSNAGIKLLIKQLKQQLK